MSQEKSRGHFLGGHLSVRKDERASAASFQRLPLQLPSLHTVIFGKENPSFLSYKREPILIRSTLGEMMGKKFDAQSGTDERVKKKFATDALVKTEDRRVRLPFGIARTGWLLRCPSWDAHSHQRVRR